MVRAAVQPRQGSAETAARVLRLRRTRATRGCLSAATTARIGDRLPYACTDVCPAPHRALRPARCCAKLVREPRLASVSLSRSGLGRLRAWRIRAHPCAHRHGQVVCCGAAGPVVRAGRNGQHRNDPASHARALSLGRPHRGSCCCPRWCARSSARAPRSCTNVARRPSSGTRRCSTRVPTGRVGMVEQLEKAADASG